MSKVMRGIVSIYLLWCVYHTTAHTLGYVRSLLAKLGLFLIGLN